MKLVEIDLSRCREKPDSDAVGECWHPDIDLDRYYLAELESANDQPPGYYTGQFSEQWYGYNFDGWGSGSGLQLDKPGTNMSSWMRLWLIEPERMDCREQVEAAVQWSLDREERMNMLFPKGKGEIIDEETLVKRIHAAVEGRIESDVEGTIVLHNFLCGGQVQIHEDSAGNPADKDGMAVEGGLTYVFTKGDDD